METHIEQFTLTALIGVAREGHSEVYSLARQPLSLTVRTPTPDILDGDIAVKIDA